MVKALINISRPKQWIKNIFVFVGVFFSHSFSNIELLKDSLWIFVAFICASIAVYSLNDIVDIEKDKVHPKKKLRPLPSGALSKEVAGLFCVFCACAALIISFKVSVVACVITGTYMILNIAYSFFLKSVVIIDVMVIAFGFLLRVFSGTYGLEIPPSSWLLICSLSLTLFLGFNKRYSEFCSQPNDKSSSRPVLEKYDRKILEHAVTICSTLSLMSYALYTLDQQTIEKFGSDYLFFTFIPVFYCIMRYQLIVERGSGGQDPSSIVLTDKGILLGGISWLAMYILLKTI
ncbi:decaprenyl-phosphate phosphoribosyltransferase [Shewanella sp. Scap07]|uniref:decaprenyl-phosphate phosphoribosyltransferase n=1 Tax=Shewanella sp. Scap07 TaxID=2589987 RepID=UPI0015B9FF8F|nr:decaprenyl-phosphate phosphoribosyltransferase [Shewanella sp. Scap07]QLE86091.1 decaprenyl-phosphate phosphoribosyltransferase [Shewanella sp. Scap07]